MLRTEREHDRFLIGGRLQLEAKAATETLTQGEPPSAVDPAAKRSVQHELHAPTLIEETLDDHAPLRGHGAQCALARPHVLRKLPRASLADLALDELRSSESKLTNRRYFRRELARAGRRFTEPKRDRGRRALGVRDAHHAATHLQDPPRRGAQLKDVPAVR